MRSFLEKVPETLAGSVKELLERPAANRDTLLADLDEYTSRIDRAVRQRGRLDVHLAEMILRACRTLLQDDWPHLGAEHQSLVRLACVYYLESDDADGDLDSPFGFDDDALVLNLVLETIGRPERQVRI
jgi:hypothetical protein